MSEDVAVASEAQPDRAPDRGEKWRSLFVVVALAAGFALVPRVTRGCEGGMTTSEIAPDFHAKIVANVAGVGPLANGATADGGTLDLSALKGRPVILDFWATWCGPCQAEAPVLNTLAQRYKDRGLAVVGVNTSDEDGLAAAFARKKNLGFPMVFDQGNTIARAYSVTSLPTLVVVSKEGRVVAVRQGVTSEEALEDIVKRYL